MSDFPLVILGAGGHASVLVELIQCLKKSLLGIIAPLPSAIKNYDVPYLGDDLRLISAYSPNEIKLINGVGCISLETNVNRKNLYERFKALGYNFEILVHPSAQIARTVNLQEGVQIMARAVVQPNTVIGENTIINTSASIDHDCQIGRHVHIAPNVTLSGNVHIGDNSFVGVGATIIQGINISDNMMIRAGRTVVKNLQLS